MWNKVEDGLPPNNKRVAVWNRTMSGFQIAKLTNGRWFPAGGFGAKKADITHWQELTPPEGEKENGTMWTSQKTTRDSQS